LGVEQVRDFLRRHRRIALDTGVFVYQLEANPRYVSLTDTIFSWLEQSRHTAVTSTITMTELLVQPYRDNDEHQVDEFYGLLSTYPNLDWVAPDLAIADIAARLRARHRLRTPDALQAATAIQGSATGLVTNDSAFQRMNDFEVVMLDELLGE
jgi:predicted nucleic acid-binding protein